MKMKPRKKKWQDLEGRRRRDGARRERIERIVDKEMGGEGEK